MEINRQNVIDVCKKSNIRPDKDYGQNFLIDPNVSKAIVDALDIKEKERVLEIGPGIGSLTHFLSMHENDIDVVDIDMNMVYFLKVFYQENKNINVINSDIRKHDVSCYHKVVANLPYNLTTEIIVYLLENAKECQKMVLMCQKEAFAHFMDLEGSEYGPTSVLIHLLGTIRRLFLVKKGAFYPAPKIDSVVFEINLDKSKSLSDALEAYKLTKALFNNRRKTLQNNLSNYLGDKELASALLSKICDPNDRPENLSPENYLKLSQLLIENKKNNI